MTSSDAWNVNGVNRQAREMARDAANAMGIDIGDWLDRLIRRRTGLVRTETSGLSQPASVDVSADGVPDDLAAALEDLEQRVGDRVAMTDALVAPLESAVDELDERARALTDIAQPDAASDDEPATSAPFYASAETDEQFAEAAVADEMRGLLDDGGPPPGAAAERYLPAIPPERIGDGGRRQMFVAAAIVVAIAGVVATLYEWSQAPVAPQATADAPALQPTTSPSTSTGPTSTGSAATAPTATAPTAPPLAASEATDRAPATVAAAPTDTQPSEPRTPEAAPPGGRSFGQPPPPGVAADSPVAALHRAAVAGDHRAQYDLAVHYLRGLAITQDHTAAAYWLREASTGGIAAAQYNLGVMHDLGLAGMADPIEAQRLFHAAADQGHARAYYALGRAYAEGKGVPTDNVRAREWFEKSAEAGVADGQIALGIMYARGLGGEVDVARAYYWFRRAELNGAARAAGLIAALTDQLSAAERAGIDDRVSRDNMSSSPATSRPRAAPPVASAESPADTVRALQRLLAELGFDPGPVDGAMGPRTRTAIEEYQRALGLPVDGRPSAALLANLRAVTGQPAR
jgi:localization factor PodJL